MNDRTPFFGLMLATHPTKPLDRLQGLLFEHKGNYTPPVVAPERMLALYRKTVCERLSEHRHLSAGSISVGRYAEVPILIVYDLFEK
jgi:hypothetical protein